VVLKLSVLDCLYLSDNGDKAKAWCNSQDNLYGAVIVAVNYHRESSFGQSSMRAR